MSLLQEAMEDFAIIKQVTSSDGYGGEITEFETLSTFKGALVFNTSSEILIARSQNVGSAYTLTTNKDVILEYHTLIKKVSNKRLIKIIVKLEFLSSLTLLVNTHTTPLKEITFNT